MARVTGIGGVFFKARDAEALRAWYRTHLGLDVQARGGVTFGGTESAGGREAVTVWTIFPETASYFWAPFMINYRVVNLAAVLAELRAEGCAVDERVDESEFGRFGWVRIPKAIGWSCGSRRWEAYLADHGATRPHSAVLALKPFA